MLYFLKRLKYRCVWSWDGTLDTWRSEHSFRSWVWANLISLVLAFLLPLTLGERALILALGINILAMELMNTAIELTVDYISAEKHELARRAKDAGSAGVAVAGIAAAVAWAFIFFRVF